MKTNIFRSSNGRNEKNSRRAKTDWGYIIRRGLMMSRGFVLTLCGIVVFTTVYSMILPGVSTTATTIGAGTDYGNTELAAAEETQEEKTVPVTETETAQEPQPEAETEGSVTDEAEGGAGDTGENPDNGGSVILTAAAPEQKAADTDEQAEAPEETPAEGNAPSDSKTEEAGDQTGAPAAGGAQEQENQQPAPQEEPKAPADPVTETPAVPAAAEVKEEAAPDASAGNTEAAAPEMPVTETPAPAAAPAEEATKEAEVKEPAEGIETAPEAEKKPEAEETEEEKAAAEAEEQEEKPAEETKKQEEILDEKQEEIVPAEPAVVYLTELAAAGLGVRAELTFAEDAQIRDGASLEIHSASVDQTALAALMADRTELNRDDIEVDVVAAAEIVLKDENGSALVPAAPVQARITFDQAADTSDGKSLGIFMDAGTGLKLIGAGFESTENSTTVSTDMDGGCVVGFIVVHEKEPVYMSQLPILGEDGTIIGEVSFEEGALIPEESYVEFAPVEDKSADVPADAVDVEIDNSEYEAVYGDVVYTLTDPTEVDPEWFAVDFLQAFRMVVRDAEGNAVEPADGSRMHVRLVVEEDAAKFEAEDEEGTATEYTLSAVKAAQNDDRYGRKIQGLRANKAYYDLLKENQEIPEDVYPLEITDLTLTPQLDEAGNETALEIEFNTFMNGVAAIVVSREVEEPVYVSEIPFWAEDGSFALKASFDIANEIEEGAALAVSFKAGMDSYSADKTWNQAVRELIAKENGTDADLVSVSFARYLTVGMSDKDGVPVWPAEGDVLVHAVFAREAGESAVYAVREKDGVLSISGAVENTGSELVLDGAVAENETIGVVVVNIEKPAQPSVSGNDGVSGNTGISSNDEEGEETEEDESIFAGDLPASMGDTGFVITIPKDAQVPAGAQVSVTSIFGDEYAQKVKSVLNKDGNAVAFVKFFTISILDENGSVVVPAAPVHVEVTDKTVVTNETGRFALYMTEDGFVEKLSGDSYSFDAIPNGVKVYAIAATCPEEEAAAEAEEAQPEEEKEEAPEQTENAEAAEAPPAEAAVPAVVYEHSLQAYENGVTVTAEMSDDAQIPAGSKLIVRVIEEGSDEYKDLVKLYNKTNPSNAIDTDPTAMQNVGNFIGSLFGAGNGEPTSTTKAKMLDISIEAPDGTIIEPNDRIRISIRMDEAIQATGKENVSVVHFEDQKTVTELTEAENAVSIDEEENGFSGVSFDTDGLSPYAVIYTVDYAYEANGEKHNASMDGGSAITLSELFVKLGVAGDQEAAGTYIRENIDTVTFSKEGVVEITPVEESTGLFGKKAVDWKIAPLRASDGSAYLIITRNDGTHAHINVEIKGVAQAESENAVISAADGRILPEDAHASAEVLEGNKKNEAVETVEQAASASSGGFFGMLSNKEETEAEKSYKVFDISLRNVETEQYANGFRVDVTLPSMIAGSDFALFHIHGDDVEELPVELVKSETEDGTEVVTGIRFVTKDFSEFVLRYTVDFEIEINGALEKFSIIGGSSITLEEVLLKLHICGTEAEAENYASKVSNVVFSDPSLVQVSYEEGHWVLKSLQAFDTKESLTIVLKDGTSITVTVRDAQMSTDLNSLRTGITVKHNGQTLQDGQTLSIDVGDRFDIHLEIEENDFFQFPDDGTPMVYSLNGTGINLGDSAFTQYVTIDMGIDGKVYRNPLTYDPATNSLTLTWNTKDPNFSKLTSTDNTKINIDVTGYADENADRLEFSDDLIVDIEFVEHHDANIQKAGQLFLPGAAGNPYGNQPAIKYTVTVTSDGETTVDVQDTVEGSAVTLDTTNWTAVSNKGTTITPTFTGKGFTLNGQDLQNGEVVTITYWGKVDTSGIENLTDVTYLQTGNKVTVSGEDIPEKEVTHYEHTVGDNKMTKTSTGVSEVDENGKQTVTWKIVANSNPLESIGGSTITDRISSDSLAYMSYSPNGVHVIARRTDNTVAFDTTYAWNSGNLSLTQTDTDKHWTFTVPETDEALTYEFYYATEVDTTIHAKGLFSVTNTTEGKPGKDSGSATVGVPDTPEPQPVNYTKKAVDVTAEEITWNISVNIDQKAEGYSPFKLVDILPKKTFGDLGYIDDFVSISVEGLEGEEHAETSFVYDYLKPDGTSSDNAYGKTGDYTKPTKVELTFYRTAGTDNPGINATANRTLNITVVTRNSEGWLELAAEQGIDHQDYLTHTNSAKINDWSTVQDTVSPMAKVVYKMRNGKVEVQGNDGTANAYTKVSTPGGSQGTPEITTKFDYPAYKFWVVVGGVNKGNLTNGNQLIIEDTFDPLFRILLDGEDSGKNTRVSASNSPTSLSTYTPDSSKGESFTWTQEDGKAEFIITNPRKNGDNYYPYYTVEYWLVPRSQEALEQIKQLTLEEGGEKIFNNTASSGDSETELGFKYTYNVIDKSVAQEATDLGVTLEKYKIEINKDKMTLNNGETMTMTDTYSRNLSVDFGTITVTATGRDGSDRSSEVTWDYRGNVGTFKIPDETYVVIQYNARVVGDPGSVQTVSNTAYMEGYFDTVTSERVVDMSGGGTAERVRVRLLKFEGDHMEEGLSGAKFRLLDQNQNPVLDKNGNEIIFTTGTGYLSKLGVIHAGGDPLDYTFNESDGTYDTHVYQGDLNETGLSRWNAGTIQNPTADPDKLVTYGDLSPAGRNRLGVNLHGGFAEIVLDQKEMGIALKKERTYYLEETVAPDGFERTNTKYSFLITDQSDYTAPGGVYVYHNNDVLTVRNWPEESPSFRIEKTFKGNVELTDEQKNQVTFQIQKKGDGDTWISFPVEIWDEAAGTRKQSETFTYGDYSVTSSTDETGAAAYEKGEALFKDGVFEIEALPVGTYRVIETNQTMTSGTGETYSRRTEYVVDGTTQTVSDETVGVQVDATDGKSHYVAVSNSYFDNKLEITKVSADTAEVLSNAEFKVVKVNADGTTQDVATGLKTDENGKIAIQLDQNTWDSEFTFDFDTLYYVVETAAPTGFILPTEPEKNYFYFLDENSSWTPGSLLPEGETAVDLSSGYGSATISNKRDETKTYVSVNKKWVNSLGRDVTDTMTDAEAVDVTLYRTIDKISSGTVITGGEAENDASEIKTLTVKNGSAEVSTLFFLKGDTVQVSVAGTGAGNASISVNPYAGAKEILTTDTRKSWTVVMPSGDTTITIGGVSADVTVAATNITGANRVYRLSQSDAADVGGEAIDGKTATLDASNSWAATFSDLDLKDSNNHPYFYYVVESGAFANSNTEYDVASKSVTITNTAPEQLEVNKKWQDEDGNSLNDETTDGHIVYELIQVVNPLAVGPYTGTGQFNVDISGVNTDGAWNHKKLNLTGDATKIKEGSKVRFEIAANSASNQDLDGIITVSGASLVSDVNELVDVPMEGWTAYYHKRTIIVDAVNGNIVLSGTMTTDATLTLVVTVLEEPTGAQTDWEQLEKKKVGDVTVTYDNATLTKTDEYATSSIRAAKGTKPWSSVIYNLPVKGDNCTYTYYLVETEATGFTTPEPAYQVNGNVVDLAVASPGDTVVIENITELTGSVKVAKTFSGIETLPEDFAITATWTDGTDKSVELKTTGTQQEGVTFSGNGTEGDPYTWTISGIPVGTVVTFEETGYEKEGYEVATNPVPAETDGKVTQTATAQAGTPAEMAATSFINTYTELPGSLKITKKVTVDGADTITTLADGDYTFVIKKDGDPINVGKVGDTEIQNGEVTITISGGVASTVEVTNLPAGVYTIEEKTPLNGIGTKLTEATGGTSVADNVVTVTVENDKTGDNVPETAIASFTNDLETTALYVKKEWSDGKNDPVTVKIRKNAYYYENETIVDYGMDRFYPDDDTTYTVTPGQTLEVKNLPKYEYKDGYFLNYVYSVIEMPVSGYHASYSETRAEDGSEAEVIIVNTPIEDTGKPTSLSVSKQWYDVAGEEVTDQYANDAIGFELIRKQLKVDNIVPVLITYQDRSGGQAIHETVYVTKGTQLTFTFAKPETLARHGLLITINGTAVRSFSVTGSGPYEYTTPAINEDTTVNAGLTWSLIFSDDAWGNEARDKDLTSVYWTHAVRAADGTGTLYKNFDELVAALSVNIDESTIEPDKYPYILSKDSISTTIVPEPYEVTMPEDSDWFATFDNLPLLEKVGDEYFLYSYEISEFKIIHGQGEGAVEENVVPITEPNPATQYNGESANYWVKWTNTDGTWVIENHEKPAKIEFIKQWKDASETAVAWPEEEIEVTVTGTSSGTGTDKVVTYKYKLNKNNVVAEGKINPERGSSGELQLSVEAIDDTVHTYKFLLENLPNYDQSGNKYIYVATESKWPEGYQPPKYYDAEGNEIGKGGTTITSGGSIVNTVSSAALPSTGGATSNLIYSLALACLTVAGLWLIYLKKDELLYLLK